MVKSSRRKKAHPLLSRLPKDWHWLAIWALIYLTFISLDIFAPHFIGSTLIKYIGIFLCLIYAYKKFKNDHLLILALLFTLLSDTILMWLPGTEVIGVFTFCFAQFFHTARFAHTSPFTLIVYFAAIFALFLFGVVQGISPIYCIAFIYAISLIMNVRLSYTWYKAAPTNPHARSAFLGFLLFLACDICVGTSYLAGDGVLPMVIYPAVAFCVWIFYYPSQVLLSNSSNLNNDHGIIPPNGR